MHKLCKEREGGPVLYELIEVCLMHDKLLLNIKCNVKSIKKITTTLEKTKKSIWLPKPINQQLKEIAYGHITQNKEVL